MYQKHEHLLYCLSIAIQFTVELTVQRWCGVLAGVWRSAAVVCPCLPRNPVSTVLGTKPNVLSVQCTRDQLNTIHERTNTTNTSNLTHTQLRHAETSLQQQQSRTWSGVETFVVTTPSRSIASHVVRVWECSQFPRLDLRAESRVVPCDKTPEL